MNMKMQALIGLHYMLKIKNKEIIKFIKNKDIIANIFRLQAYDSIMCGYFCIEFIDYMFDDKTLIDFTNLFSPYDFLKNDIIIKDIIINQKI